MKWNKSRAAVSLSNVASQGLGTLSVGTYTGRFVGRLLDADGTQWITVVTAGGTHIESSDLDVSQLVASDKINFRIEPRHGAVALMNGTRYQLVQDGKELTGWLPLSEIYEYIQANKIILAEPKLVSIEKIEESN